MKSLILIIVLTLPLGGCALLAAGIVGGIVTHEIDGPACWNGYETYPCHYGAKAYQNRHAR